MMMTEATLLESNEMFTMSSKQSFFNHQGSQTTYLETQDATKQILNEAFSLARLKSTLIPYSNSIKGEKFECLTLVSRHLE